MASFTILPMRIRTFYILFACLWSMMLSGQSLEFKAQYQQAKTELANAAYQKAKAMFQKLENEKNPGNYAPYILYYQAVCERKLSNTDASAKLLTLLKSKYPTWPKMMDVDLALGNLLLTTDTQKALDLYNGLVETKFLKAANESILAQAELFTAENLKKYASTYPKLTAFSQLLKKAENTQNWSFDSRALPIFKPEQIAFKDKSSVNVAVLFPFGSAAEPKNQFAYDMLEGMKTAQNILKNENIKLNINLYNVNNDVKTMLELLSNKNFLQNDLIIGPLYTETNKYAQWAANQYQKIIISPMAHENKHSLAKKYSFMALGSDKCLAQSAAKKLANKFSGAALIVENPTGTDSLAYYYEKELRAAGISVSKIKLGQNIPKGSFGHVFLTALPSQHKNLIKTWSQKAIDIPIVSYRHHYQEPVNQYFNEKNQLYFINQEYLDESSEKLKQFKSNFWEKTNGISNMYTYKGHDLLLFWGRQYHKYRQNTHYMVQSKNFDDDYLIQSFDFSGESFENKAFKLTEYRNGTEILVDIY